MKRKNWEDDDAYSPNDDYDNKREGWAVFECDDGALRIQRLDDPRAFADDMPENPLFDSDADAVAFVSLCAVSSHRHLRAMMLHNTAALEHAAKEQS